MNHKMDTKIHVVLYNVTINFYLVLSSLYCYLGTRKGKKKNCFSLRQMLHNTNIIEKKKILRSGQLIQRDLTQLLSCISASPF